MTSSSLDVIYSTKNYPKFGLYRYESTTSPRRIERDKRNKLLLIRAFCVVGVLVAVAIIIFSIVDHISSWNDETERIIFLSKNNPKISNEQHQSNHQMTTVYYPDEQISSYHSTQSITTTPMNSIPNSHLHSIQNASRSKSETPMELKSTALPPNHKRYYSQVLQNRNDIEMDYMQKSEEHKTSETELKSRMFFPNDDNIDIHEYYDIPKVNSIQDILDEGNDNGHEFNDIISSSIPFSRGMKIEGTYRREMKKRDFINSIEALNSENIPLRDEQNIKNSNDLNDPNDDPFSKFKPKSPDDVNSLAAANQQQSSKFTSNFYAVHRPRPLTIATTYNPYMNDYADSQDPHFIYHQVIAASNSNQYITPKASSLFESATIKKQKPFSLMLDVYPMNDDEQKTPTSIVSPTHNLLYKRPYYPVNMNAINHNLQHVYYNQMKFPQLQQFRAPYRDTTNQNDAYFRKYIMNRMGPQQFHPTTSVKQSTFSQSDLVNTNAPSQITVHLNLYPNRKKSHARNVEIIDIGETIDNSPNVETIKRFENNFNNLNIQETQSHGQFNIPSFSAININSLQPQFNSNDTAELSSDPNLDDEPIYNLSKSKPFNVRNAIAEPTKFSLNNYNEDIKTTSITETTSDMIRFPNQ